MNCCCTFAASSGTVAKVIIIANDGTQGEVIFPAGSAE